MKDVLPFGYIQCLVRIKAKLNFNYQLGQSLFAKIVHRCFSACLINSTIEKLVFTLHLIQTLHYIPVITSAMANAVVIYSVYHKSKGYKRLHLLLISVLILDIILAVTSHLMIDLAAFGIDPDLLFGKYGNVLFMTFICYYLWYIFV